MCDYALPRSREPAQRGLAPCVPGRRLIGLLAVDDLLAIASAALGVAVADPVDLGGSERSAVLRCRPVSGGTVILKSYPLTADGAESFVAEAAGLAFTSAAGVGPQLLAADVAEQLIVMSDLGDAPSLADLLLGESAAMAASALLGWALACGQLAVRTADEQPELSRLRATFAGSRARADADPAADRTTGSDAGAAGSDTGTAGGHWLARQIQSVPDLLGALSLTEPAGLGAELDAVAAIVVPDSYQVFSPGDICPDNNLLTTAGIRFIDYESAEFHSAFLDAAYLRMPFSSCWCVFRLPAELHAATEAAYRAQVCRVFPELADDEIWQPGVRLATAAWTLHALTYLLEPSMIADRPMHDHRTPAPTARQLLRYRWQRLRDELGPAGELPAITALMSSLLDVTRSWHTPDLPPYPSFR